MERKIMINRFAIAAWIVASPAFGHGVDPLIGAWKFLSCAINCHRPMAACEKPDQ
jgi:hypothetical protein